MPIYIFKCANRIASHTHEVIVPYDRKTTKCPTCGLTARRQGIEVPARRNPAHGIQRNERGL